MLGYPTGIRRNDNAIMTPKRRFGAIMTLLLRRVSAGYSQWLLHQGEGCKEGQDATPTHTLNNAFTNTLRVTPY